MGKRRARRRRRDAADADAVAAATIPVERIRGDVLVIAGGDDQVWPSVEFAQAIHTRRKRHGLSTTLVTHRDAGHRTLLPGEEPVAGGQDMARGGSPDSDAELGELAWPHILRTLHVD